MRQSGLGVLMALAGCMTQPASQADPAALPARDAVPRAFDAITLERTPCFGSCPVYSVTVHDDGRVEFRGERWVASQGGHAGEADPQELEKLRDLLRSRPLPMLADYRPGKPACGTPVATDMPGARITIERATETRTLHYYEGCPNIPEWLVELAAGIDKAAVSSRWIEGDRAPER